MESPLKKIFENRELRETFSKVHPEYVGRHRQISKKLEEWKKELSPDAYERLESLLTMQAEAEGLQCLEDFRYGLKLGILLCIEILELQ